MSGRALHQQHDAKPWYGTPGIISRHHFMLLCCASIALLSTICDASLVIVPALADVFPLSTSRSTFDTTPYIDKCTSSLMVSYASSAGLPLLRRCNAAGNLSHLAVKVLQSGPMSRNLALLHIGPAPAPRGELKLS